MRAEAANLPPDRIPTKRVGVLFLIFAIPLAIAQFLGPRDRMPWRYDLAIAQAEARKAGKPVLACFSAETCGPCLTVKKTVWCDQRVADAARAYVPVLIDIDRRPELRKRYDVRAIPLVAVLDEQGKVVRSVTGAMEPGEMVAWLAQSTN